MQNDDSVMVVGGAGFIGSHLVGKLLQRPGIKRVVVYDNLSSGTRAHLADSASDERVELVEADIKHLGLLTAAMRGGNVVFHLAANPDIAKAAQPDIDFWEGTYLAQNVLEAMRMNSVAGSSIRPAAACMATREPRCRFAEDHGPCLPISTYGASKLACEALIAGYCSHVWSARPRVSLCQCGGTAPDAWGRLRLRPPSQDRSLAVAHIGDGSQSKWYIHVDDILAASSSCATKSATKRASTCSMSPPTTT